MKIDLEELRRVAEAAQELESIGIDPAIALALLDRIAELEAAMNTTIDLCDTVLAGITSHPEMPETPPQAVTVSGIAKSLRYWLVGGPKGTTNEE